MTGTKSLLSALALITVLAAAACSGSTSDVSKPEVGADGYDAAIHDGPGGQECTDATQCDDQNPCTTDQCGEDGQCLNITLEGATCDDGNACTTGDTCSSDALCQGAENLQCDNGDPCSEAECDPKSGCAFIPKAEGAPCDDGSACTSADTCLDGACVGAASVCEDDDPCTTDGCDHDTGDCLHTPTSNVVCSDGNACTVDDVCFEGVCQGTAVDEQEYCDDGNACTTDWCQEEPKETGGGCKHQIAPESTQCDDKNACTEEDACTDQGICTGSPVFCNDGNQCTADQCDSATGCYYEDTSNTPCDDGDPCTVSDMCADGECISGAPKNCHDDNPCTVDSCAASGECQHITADELCDDGLYCTGVETCHAQDGCVAGPPPPLDDGNPCTDDMCSELLQEVLHQPANALCDDGDVCNGSETCDETEGCLSGAPLVCDDGVLCTVDSCDPVLGCLNSPELSLCDDDNPCTADSCDPTNDCTNEPLSGLQEEVLCCGNDPAICDDGNQCTDDACDQESWACTSTITEIGTPCNDGLVCTAQDACALGLCLGAGVSCDDGLACTTDGCEEPTGCVFLPDHASCDDNDVCNGQEACALDVGCTAGAPLLCDDGLACTVDTCDPIDGCQAEPADEVCNDNNPCTADGCLDGLGCIHFYAGGVQEGIVCCDSPSSPQCDDQNMCTDDSCALALFQCENLKLPSGTPCDDDLVCTIDDQCSKGACAGIADGCDDSLDCTVDSCTEPLGCQHSPDDTACHDGNFCNGEETCDALAGCLDGQEVICNDDLDCTIDLCEPFEGCLYIPDDTACDDNDVCTGAEECLAAAPAPGTGCIAIDPPKCDDGVTCTVDGCDPVHGCSSTPVDSLCDDGFQCTEAVCDAQDGCVETPNHSLCDDQFPCTEDLCDVAKGCVFLPNHDACDDSLDCTVDICPGDAPCDNSSVVDGWCQVEDACHEAGAVDPQDPCSSCVPEADQHAWTYADLELTLQTFSNGLGSEQLSFGPELAITRYLRLPKGMQVTAADLTLRGFTGPPAEEHLTGYWGDDEWSNKNLAEDEDWGTASSVSKPNRQIYVNHPFSWAKQVSWSFKYSCGGGGQNVVFQCFNYLTSAWATLHTDSCFNVPPTTVTKDLYSGCLQDPLQLRVHSCWSNSYYEGYLNFPETKPNNPRLEVGTPDGAPEWEWEGFLDEDAGVQSVPDLVPAISAFLEECEPDEFGYCLVPFLFETDSAGLLEYSELSVEYDGCPACLGDCTGKECGDDGCGGSCGGCPDGLSCIDATCQGGCALLPLEFAKHPDNPVLSAGGPGSAPSETSISGPSVFEQDGDYLMIYSSTAPNPYGRYFDAATSADGIVWTKYASNPLTLNGHSYQFGRPDVVWNGEEYRVWLDSVSGGGAQNGNWGTWLTATSADGLGWGGVAGFSGLSKTNNSFVYHDGSYHGWTQTGGEWVYHVSDNGVDFTEAGPTGVLKADYGIFQVIAHHSGAFIATGRTGSEHDYHLHWLASSDGVNWELCGEFLQTGEPGEWDAASVGGVAILFEDAGTRIWYGGNSGAAGAVGLAVAVF